VISTSAARRWPEILVEARGALVAKDEFLNRVWPDTVVEAIVEFKRSIELSGHSGAFDSYLGYAYAMSGQKEEATKIIDDFPARHGQNPSAYADIALIYVGLGDPDQAMISLNKAYEARFKASILLRPAFDLLRSDARFQDLLRRIGLPQAGHDLLR
jgi:Flp pilus assembly protein TadD